MAELILAAFQYPENPEWSVQTDERDGMLRQINAARRFWPLFSLLMKMSPAARDALHGCVWEEDGQPVGLVNIIRDGATDDWIIVNVAVLPAYRRRGIARALVEAAVDLARTHRAKDVVLDVIAGNTPAYDLYNRLGFEQFATSVHLRHATPATASADEPRIPADYTTTAVSSQTWRPYFELARHITPPDVQRFRPVTEQQFHMAPGMRLLMLTLAITSGIRQRGWLVRTTAGQQIVAAIQLSAHTHGVGMNMCTIWLDQAHRELATYLVRFALHLSHQWSPKSRIELTIPSWEPALIEAATASDFARAFEGQSMGMKL